MKLDTSTETLKKQFSKERFKLTDDKHPILQQIGIEPTPKQFQGICYAFGLNPLDLQSRNEWNRIRRDIEDAVLQNAIESEIDISSIEPRIEPNRLKEIKDKAKKK